MGGNIQQSKGRNTTSDLVIDTLEGAKCSFCDDGVLVRGVYKEKTAVICEACEVPSVQLFQLTDGETEKTILSPRLTLSTVVLGFHLPLIDNIRGYTGTLV